MASSAIRERSTGSAGEGPPVGATEQEQCFGEVDRSGIDLVEAVDKLAVVAVWILAGDVEEGLRHRQRGTQLMGRVGREPLLFGDVCLEPREQAVDGVGEILQLVAGPREREALVQVALGDLSGARRHRPQRLQDTTRDEPAERDRDDGHDRQHDPRPEEPLVKILAGTADASADLSSVAAGPPGWPTLPRPGRDDQVDPGGWRKSK